MIPLDALAKAGRRHRVLHGENLGWTLTKDGLKEYRLFDLGYANKVTGRPQAEWEKELVLGDLLCTPLASLLGKPRPEPYSLDAEYLGLTAGVLAGMVFPWRDPACKEDLERVIESRKFHYLSGDWCRQADMLNPVFGQFLRAVTARAL